MLDLDGEKERGLDTPHIPGIHLNLLQLLNSTKCVKLRIKWGKSQNLNAQPKKVKIVFFPLQYFTSVDFKKKIASTVLGIAGGITDDEDKFYESITPKKHPFRNTA